MNCSIESYSARPSSSTSRFHSPYRFNLENNFVEFVVVVFDIVNRPTSMLTCSRGNIPDTRNVVSFCKKKKQNKKQKTEKNDKMIK